MKIYDIYFEKDDRADKSRSSLHITFMYKKALIS